jgi:hypothetical protein
MCILQSRAENNIRHFETRRLKDGGSAKFGVFGTSFSDAVNQGRR